jgi:hypothetical protein
MKLFLLLFIPFGLVWLWTKNRNRAYRWLGFGVILAVQIFSLLPVGAIAFALYVAAESETAIAGNNIKMGNIYSDFRITQGQMHGLKGWEGVDIKAGCGSPIYAPFSGKVTRKGLDGYNHVDTRGVVYDQNTILTIQGESGLELTLLHGDYRVNHGDTIIQGDLLGYESSIGWSTGCHSHVILKQNGRTLNYLDWQATSRQTKPLKISWYDPILGGVNCDSDCSTMATGAKVTEDRYGRTAACIREWAGKTVVIAGLGEFECLDRGGAIIEHEGYIWIDLLLHEPMVPFGTLIYEWELK